MGDNIETLLTFNNRIQSDQIRKETDNGNLLPTDDQLDRLVDCLCDNIPSLNLNQLENFGSSEVQKPCNSTVVESHVDVSDQEHIYSNTDFDLSDSLEKTVEKLCIKDGTERQITTKNSYLKSMEYYNSDRSVKNSSERRSLPNTNLNIAIMQCSRTLDLLVEKRKNLELLLQMRHNVANINYNFSYTPRLPDSPTRVDRLLYDVNQERCRILGLMTALEKTINSFSSKSTKDELRKLLVAYSKAIVDVIKERQSEINYFNNGVNSYDAGVGKLVSFINEVHCMNRRVHTALWCIEVKEQVGLVMSRKQGAAKPPKSQEQKPTEMVMLQQKSWHSTKVIQQKPPVSPRSARTSSNVSKSRCFPVRMMQQQTNVFQVISPPRQKKSTAMQLYAQEQRAEIFQRFSSTLKQSS